jgi:arylsulfatase
MGIVPEGVKSFPRLPSVEAWDKMSTEERAEAARDMEVYAAMVDYMDEQIKRVLDYLREIGEYDNTMVIFFSDNGANGAPRTMYPGQTDEYLESFDNSLENRGLPNSYIDMGPGWAQASMSPSRMFKGFTAEGGIKSPLIVKMPGEMSNAGTINHSFFHVRDIMPTILSLAGAEHSETFEGRVVKPMQGHSVLDLFEGRVTTASPEISRVGYELFGLKAYFVGEWKILSMPKPFGSGEWELFDLSKDPAEMNDLSKINPEKREEMIALWEKYKKENGVLEISFDLSGVK